MEGFPWKKEYEIGLEKIDKQHRVLVDLIDKLMKAHDKGQASSMEEILDSLKNYIFIHFKYEEALFVKHKWDSEKLNHHKEGHEQFIHKVDEYFNIFRRGNPDFNEQILEFLKEWLFSHILVEDKKYVEFMKEKGEI